MKLDSERLDKALKLTGELLSRKGKGEFHLIVCGGSALLALGITGRATGDVDIFASRNLDGEISRAHPLPEILIQAAREVADELDLERNWLNASASFHFPDFHSLPQAFWRELETIDYGDCLRIGFVSRSGQILLKLYAALNREEARDFEDLRELAPDTRETSEGLEWLIRCVPGLAHPDRLPGLLIFLRHEELIEKFTR